MADAAARREARRKRILENSENRLQRITGTNNTVREDIKPSDSFTPSNRDAKEPEYEIVPDANVCAEPVEPEKKLFNNTEDFLTRQSSSSNELLRKRNTLVHHEDTNHDVINERFTPSERQPNIVNNVTNESEQDANTHDSLRRLSTQTSLSLNLLFASKWILVLLAALVNVLYVLQLQHICGKTILAPFFALMLLRLHLVDNNSESQSGSMLSAALILCNIKPELVYSLRWLTRTLKKIFQEFSIYIFTFVIFYNAACTYWKNIDITILTIESGKNGELQ